MILVNFKNYKQSFGDGAIKLAKICKEVMEETGVKIIPVVSALDAYRIQKEVGIKVYLQSIDEFDEGAQSGFVSPMAAKELGIEGSLINHSEHRLKPGTILRILKKLPTDFETILCLQTLGQTERWAKNVKPKYIAYEPKQFIGNREKSVASEKPEVIKKMVEKYPKITVLVGAGVHSKEDVVTSIGLGAKGILVATDVVKADDPKKELSKLASGFSV
jgi:triosephosphate isomerase